jgi:hypothetical protein
VTGHVWKNPTRRAFVAMLGAAAAALGIHLLAPDPIDDRDPAPREEAPKPRWIGHF